MKATGIVRRIDDLGRVVIPKEVRRQLRIREGDPLELFIENNAVVFQKYSPMIISQSADNAAVVLRKAGIPFAIYDCDILINGNKFTFPADVPEDWLDHRSNFTSPLNNGKQCTVFPIMVTGELMGFLAVCSEKIDYAEAVAGMIGTEIEQLF